MIKPYTRLVITGDSVTDCGRARPVGCKNTGLGSSYAQFVDLALSAKYPEKLIWVENTGIGGDTSLALRRRFTTDVMDRNPDIVTIMIGINNVWRHFDIGQYFPADVEKFDLPYYEDDLRYMIEQTRAKGSRLILLTPYFLEPNRQDPMRAMCDEYGTVVKRLAAEYGLLLCDIQAAFDDYLKKTTSYHISADRVHPNQTGHYIIADALLHVLEQL